MKQNLRVSLGAVVLALATLAAVIFALLNFDQRNRYDQTYDGVTWIDTEQGVQARHVAPNSPASHTAIHSGDILVTSTAPRSPARPKSPGGSSAPVSGPWFTISSHATDR